MAKSCEVEQNIFLQNVVLETMIEPSDLFECPLDCDGPTAETHYKNLPILGLVYKVTELTCPYRDVKIELGYIASKLRST